MKTSISKNMSLIVAASFALSFSSPAQAQGLFGAQEVKRWDMCDWRKIPDGVLARIERRSDYEDILRRMINSCPDAALALTDRPTATSGASDNSDDQRGREPDNGSPDGDDDDDGNPGGGPENEGPPDDGPEDNGPPNDGPPNGGPPNGGPPADNPPATG